MTATPEATLTFTSAQVDVLRVVDRTGAAMISNRTWEAMNTVHVFAARALVRAGVLEEFGSADGAFVRRTATVEETPAMINETGKDLASIANARNDDAARKVMQDLPLYALRDVAAHVKAVEHPGATPRYKLVDALLRTVRQPASTVEPSATSVDTLTSEIMQAIADADKADRKRRAQAARKAHAPVETAPMSDFDKTYALGLGHGFDLAIDQLVDLVFDPDRVGERIDPRWLIEQVRGRKAAAVLRASGATS